MNGFYFAFLAVLLAGLGARDQVTVAGLAARQGARPGVLLVGIVVSIGTALFAAWAATTIAPLLTPTARMVFAALALVLGGGELLVIRPRRGPLEPTASLGALAVVLIAHQATDAARFLIFAIAVATNASIPAAIGGAIGGVAMLTAGWLAPELAMHPRTRSLRLGLGVFLLLAGLFMGLRAFGRI